MDCLKDGYRYLLQHHSAALYLDKLKECGEFSHNDLVSLSLYHSLCANTVAEGENDEKGDSGCPFSRDEHLHRLKELVYSDASQSLYLHCKELFLAHSEGDNVKETQREKEWSICNEWQNIRKEIFPYEEAFVPTKPVTSVEPAPEETSILETSSKTNSQSSQPMELPISQQQCDSHPIQDSRAKELLIINSDEALKFFLEYNQAFDSTFWSQHVQWMLPKASLTTQHKDAIEPVNIPTDSQYVQDRDSVIKKYMTLLPTESIESWTQHVNNWLNNDIWRESIIAWKKEQLLLEKHPELHPDRHGLGKISFFEHWLYQQIHAMRLDDGVKGEQDGIVETAKESDVSTLSTIVEETVNDEDRNAIATVRKFANVLERVFSLDHHASNNDTVQHGYHLQPHPMTNELLSLLQLDAKIHPVVSTSDLSSNTTIKTIHLFPREVMRTMLRFVSICYGEDVLNLTWLQLHNLKKQNPNRYDLYDYDLWDDVLQYLINTVSWQDFVQRHPTLSDVIMEERESEREDESVSNEATWLFIAEMTYASHQTLLLTHCSAIEDRDGQNSKALAALMSVYHRIYYLIDKKIRLLDDHEESVKRLKDWKMKGIVDEDEDVYIDDEDDDDEDITSDSNAKASVVLVAHRKQIHQLALDMFFLCHPNLLPTNTDEFFSTDSDTESSFGIDEMESIIKHSNPEYFGHWERLFNEALSSPSIHNTYQNLLSKDQGYIFAMTFAEITFEDPTFQRLYLHPSTCINEDRGIRVWIMFYHALGHMLSADYQLPEKEVLKIESEGQGKDEHNEVLESFSRLEEQVKMKLSKPDSSTNERNESDVVHDAEQTEIVEPVKQEDAPVSDELTQQFETEVQTEVQPQVFTEPPSPRYIDLADDDDDDIVLLMMQRAQLLDSLDKTRPDDEADSSTADRDSVNKAKQWKEEEKKAQRERQLAAREVYERDMRLGGFGPAGYDLDDEDYVLPAPPVQLIFPAATLDSVNVSAMIGNETESVQTVVVEEGSPTNELEDVVAPIEPHHDTHTQSESEKVPQIDSEASNAVGCSTMTLSTTDIVEPVTISTSAISDHVANITVTESPVNTTTLAATSDQSTESVSPSLKPIKPKPSPASSKEDRLIRSMQSYLSLAQALYDKQDCSAYCQKHLAKVIKNVPPHVPLFSQAITLRGRCHIMNHEYAEAVEDLLTVITLTPSDDESEREKERELSVRELLRIPRLNSGHMYPQGLGTRVYETLTSSSTLSISLSALIERELLSDVDVMVGISLEYSESNRVRDAIHVMDALTQALTRQSMRASIGPMAERVIVMTYVKYYEALGESERVEEVLRQATLVDKTLPVEDLGMYINIHYTMC